MVLLIVGVSSSIGRIMRLDEGDLVLGEAIFRVELLVGPLLRSKSCVGTKV